MSWLYTIFVAGLLFSNGSDLNLPLLNEPASELVIHTYGDLVEKSSEIYPLSAKGRVSVSNVNGPIVLEPWDRNEVQVEVTKIADGEESMDLIDIDVSAKRDYLRIESTINSVETPEGPEHFRKRRVEVHFRLKIPRGAVLNEIQTANGNITAADFTNVTKLSALNGNITARNLKGSSKLSTVNGQLKAVFDQLDQVSAMHLETVNGRVFLEVPSDIDATIKADTRNGSISNEFGLPIRKGRTVGRDLYGRIGTGAVPLHLTSVNGGLFISRRKDGKALNPVTNLLNTRSDETDEVDVSGVEHAVRSESVAQSVNRAVRTAERSVKAAEKDLEKAHAVTEKMKKDEMADVKVKLDEKEFKNLMGEGVKQAGVFAELGESLWSASPASVEQRSASYGVKGTPKVSIDASTCAVRIRSWDQPTVKYVLTEERLPRDGALRITQNVTETSVGIKVTSPGRPLREGGLWDSPRNRFRIEVYVPKKTDITVMTEKDIRVEGVSGRLDLNANDAPVSVRDSEGSLKLRSGDGLIRIVGFKGDLDLSTGDSDVYLEGDFTKINAAADDANITLTMPSTQNANITTNTAIQSEGLNIVRDGERTWKLGSGGPKYEFEFAEGQLTVRNQARVDVN